MRIVHTSDWHAGRRWKGVDRLKELQAVLDHMATWIGDNGVDLLLHTGDVFDNGAPAARAERVVFRFLKRIGDAGVKSVVIAGNHDNARRLEAWGILAELVGVHVVGRPRNADEGGVLTLTTTSGETAKVACVPFAAVRDLISAADLAEDDAAARTSYADILRRLVGSLAETFTPSTVNLMMLHTHLDTAVLAHSERRVHVGEQWAATPQALPATAHYVALGHIHKPQRVAAAPSPTVYAGSPLALDFGEVGEDKSFVVVDVAPGTIPAKIDRVPYEGGLPLADVKGTLEQLRARQSELVDAGWLRVTVPLDAPDPEINRAVRRLLPNAVVVHAELAEAKTAETGWADKDASPSELYAAWHERARGEAPEQPLLDAFGTLYKSQSRS